MAKSGEIRPGNIQAGQWGAEFFDPRIVFGHLRDSDFGGFLHAPFDAFIVQGIFVFGVFVARVFRSGANGGQKRSGRRLPPAIGQMTDRPYIGNAATPVLAHPRTGQRLEQVLLYGTILFRFVGQ